MSKYVVCTQPTAGGLYAVLEKDGKKVTAFLDAATMSLWKSGKKVSNTTYEDAREYNGVIYTMYRDAMVMEDKA